jgi:hypothetical protein
MTKILWTALIVTEGPVIALVGRSAMHDALAAFGAFDSESVREVARHFQGAARSHSGF